MKIRLNTWYVGGKIGTDTGGVCVGGGGGEG